MSLRLTAKPNKYGRHPRRPHLVMAEIDPHHGSYIFTVEKHSGSALIGGDDARHIMGDCFDRGWGYVSEEYLGILTDDDA